MEKPLKNEMDIHEFIRTLQENKDLYNQEEYIKLCDIAYEEYQEYLLKKYYKD